MNSAPSEASILRSLLEDKEKELKEAQAKIQQFREALEHTLQLGSRFGANMRDHVAVKRALRPKASDE